MTLSMSRIFQFNLIQNLSLASAAPVVPLTSLIAPAKVRNYNRGGKLPDGENVRDREKLRRIARGDQNALEALYFDYEKRLYVYIYRMVQSHEGAEEVLNDVFMAIWKSAGSFRDGSRVSTWIFSIARNKTNDYLRKSGSKYEQEDITDTIPDRARHEEQFSNRDHVKKALEKLSPTHREVIQLIFFLDLSMKESAEVMACPVNTVKTRLHHAKKNLETILGKNYGKYIEQS